MVLTIDRADTVDGDGPRQPQSAAGCCPGIAPETSLVSEAEAVTYASWFKALADPTRIRILNLLARHEGPLCVCEIVDHFSLGQPTISHHLRILRDARFVQAERRGTWAYYAINRACLAEFPEAARQIMQPAR